MEFSSLFCLYKGTATAQVLRLGRVEISTVEFPVSQGYVPPNGRGWVDHIRTKGNAANHEIRLRTPEPVPVIWHGVEIA